jgi:RNA polymerase sigma factor (sigma-70 family)
MALNANVIPSTPSLDDYVETLISTTARKSVRSGSIRRDDRDDLEQDLRLAVLTSFVGYNPTKASWHTYANGVVRCALKMRLRGHHAACRHPRRCRSLIVHNESSDHETVTDIIDGSTLEDQRQREFAEEVQVVVDRLSEDQRAMAALLMDTSPGQAMQLLGWSRSRFYQMRARIRAAFESAELVPA